MSELTIGDRVMTPDGTGEIAERSDFQDRWWLVLLDVPRWDDQEDVLYYSEDELKTEER